MRLRIDHSGIAGIFHGLDAEQRVQYSCGPQTFLLQRTLTMCRTVRRMTRLYVRSVEQESTACPKNPEIQG
jgi:hypothetical protein